MQTTVLILGSWLQVVPLSFGQTIALPPGIPIVSNATVNPQVNFDQNSQTFRYAYTIANSSASVGSINEFQIDITTTGGATLLSGGLSNSATHYLQNTSEFVLSKIGSSLIPVGFVSAPTGWWTSLSMSGAASFFGPLPPGTKIAPGQVLGQFVLASPGFPGIRKFIVQPSYDPNDFFPSVDDTDISAAQQEQFTLQDIAARKAIKFSGFTVGPVQPPSLTDSSQLLDFLISLKHQSVSLGWFFGPGVDGIVNSLDAKLSAAKDSVASGDNQAAADQLNAFINELDAQRGKHLNDNAYYLLKTNAQFIIGKLQ